MSTSFSDSEVRDFATYEQKLATVPEDEALKIWEEINQSLEKSRRFLAWRIAEKKKWLNNLPKPDTAAILKSLKAIDFKEQKGLEEYSRVYQQYYDVPRIPLASTPKFNYEVLLGFSLKSAENVSPPENNASRAATKAVEKAVTEKITPQSYADGFSPDVKQDTSAASWDLKLGLQIGQVIAQVAGSKSTGLATFQDTGYVLVVNAIDNSVWLVHNYYQVNDNGLCRFTPVQEAPRFDIGPSTGTTFDTVQIFDNIRTWDASTPLKSLTGQKALLQQLVARPVSDEEYTKLATTQPTQIPQASKPLP